MQNRMDAFKKLDQEKRERLKKQGYVEVSDKWCKSEVRVVTLADYNNPSNFLEEKLIGNMTFKKSDLMQWLDLWDNLYSDITDNIATKNYAKALASLQHIQKKFSLTSWDLNEPNSIGVLHTKILVNDHDYFRQYDDLNEEFDDYFSFLLICHYHLGNKDEAEKYYCNYKMLTISPRYDEDYIFTPSRYWWLAMHAKQLDHQADMKEFLQTSMAYLKRVPHIASAMNAIELAYAMTLLSDGNVKKMKMQFGEMDCYQIFRNATKQLEKEPLYLAELGLTSDIKKEVNEMFTKLSKMTVTANGSTLFDGSRAPSDAVNTKPRLGKTPK